MARTAEVKRDARIGEAEARCDAQIKEAIAEGTYCTLPYLFYANCTYSKPWIFIGEIGLNYISYVLCL